ncbi:Glucooligosaccharide oxidase [Atractiella rhizophila]|nr:Glucooligosaccharide oxidase [Atractiella rhizophila]
MSTLSLFLLPLFASAAPSVATRSLETCVNSAGVAAVFPSSPEYANASIPYNNRFTKTPDVISYPSTAREVSEVLTCAKSFNKSVTSLSGGHSYAAFSLDGDVIVNLKNMSSYEFVEEGNRAKVGPGMLLGDLALNLASNGRAMPHGTCPTVGVGGHVSEGGYGYYSRLWGLALDHIVGLEAVLADGSIVKANSKSNPDLYWALKGAAPSYAVITEFELSTEPMPEDNVYFLVTFDVNATQAAEALLRVQDYIETAPKELGLNFRFFQGHTNDTIQLDYLGQWFGTVADFNASFASQWDSLPPPRNTSSIQQVSWLDNLVLQAGTSLNSSDPIFYKAPAYYKSLEIEGSSRISKEQAYNFTNYLVSINKADLVWQASMDNWGGAQSAINDIRLDSTSFGSRSTFVGWQLFGYPPTALPPLPDDAFDLIEGMYGAFVNNAPSDWQYGGYVNYVDSELTPEEAYEMYYKPHIQRLEKLKKKFDPTNLFRYPQSIGQ